MLKFHEPGLAPALDTDGATHIDLSGQPVYEQRYIRTFGFYQHRAAVDTGDSWFHVRVDGTPLYSRRYRWCGNYQAGRCAVRNGENRYLHLDITGEPAYKARWAYAGDFRDGIAVVQQTDGSHTHIDMSGRALHGCWFVDLDVFHKGFARARDQRGWTHINHTGQPLYQRRFAAVEPFYNGQARVERFDGGLEVIDETGCLQLELRSARESPFAQLSSDMVGFWRTQTIAAAVQLSMIEALPDTSAAIARRCVLDEQRTARLLRALEEMSIVERRSERWHVSAKGKFLARTHPRTLADAALEYAGPMGHLWQALPKSLIQDSSWRAPDIFADVAGTVGRAESHHRMLRSYARHDYSQVPQALALRGDERVLDAGGGVGTLAKGILDAYSGVSVSLLDRPEVLALVDTPTGLRERLNLVPADLFDAWPLRVEAVVLARVLHDWDDRRAVQILSNARAVLPAGGSLYVIEMLLPEQGGAGGLCDLHLLMVTGGQEAYRATIRGIVTPDRFHAEAGTTTADVAIVDRRCRPMTNVPEDVGSWRIPPSTLRWVDRIPRDRPVAMLIRHSVRSALPEGDAAYRLPITQSWQATGGITRRDPWYAATLGACQSPWSGRCRPRRR